VPVRSGGGLYSGQRSREQRGRRHITRDTRLLAEVCASNATYDKRISIASITESNEVSYIPHTPEDENHTLSAAMVSLPEAVGVVEPFERVTRTGALHHPLDHGLPRAAPGVHSAKAPNALSPYASGHSREASRIGTIREPACDNVTAFPAPHHIDIDSVASIPAEEQLPAIATLIVDDCTLHREILASALAVSGLFSSALAWDSPSLCAALSRTTPDVVLLNMGSHDNVALLRSVRDLCPHARVIALGISEDDDDKVVACAESGVAGYHLRTESLEDLSSMITRVIKGESVCSPRVSAILLKRLSSLATQRQPATRELVLTTREIQILRMLELGLTNRDIADRLCIALHTVKNHVHSVLSKLGVRTRAEAAAYSRSFAYAEPGSGN
jgi:DNA-binding NarL/FixJ family response regulator